MAPPPAQAGDVSPIVSKHLARDLGPASPDQQVDLSFVLRVHNPGALSAVAESRSGPSSARMTPATFEKAFLPDTGTLGEVESQLAAGGLHIQGTLDGGMVIRASGTVATIDHFLRTAIHSYSFHGQTAIGNATRAHLPPFLRGQVLAIAGLNTFGIVRPADSGGASAPMTTSPGATGPFTPQELRTAYDLTPVLQDGITGSGETVAIIDAGTFSQSDVSTFNSTFGIQPPAPATVTPVDTGNDGSDSGWNFETTLDVEWAQSMAPGAAIDVYEIPDASDQSIIDALAQIDQATALPSVISMSFGGDENYDSASSLAAMNQLFEQAAAEGNTPVAASGDYGTCTDDWEDSCGVVQFPASDPYVTAVGGTQLTLNADNTVSDEVTWDAGGGASGGGYSDVFGSPAPAVTGPARGVPDVAAVADDLQTYVGGAWNPGAGTSYATPMWAGMIALAAQNKGASFGDLNPVLYGLPSSAFHDITTGSNALQGVSSSYAAAAGWDAVTGLGSPDGYALVSDLKTAVSPAAPTAAVVGLTSDGNLARDDDYLIGYGFGKTQPSGSEVDIETANGLEPATVVAWTDSMITFHVPAGLAAGSYPVSLKLSSTLTLTAPQNLALANQVVVDVSNPTTTVSIGNSTPVQAVKLVEEDPYGTPLPTQGSLGIEMDLWQNNWNAAATVPLSVYKDPGLTQPVAPSVVYQTDPTEYDAEFTTVPGGTTLYVASQNSGDVSYYPYDMAGQDVEGYGEGTFLSGPVAGIQAHWYYDENVASAYNSSTTNNYVSPNATTSINLYATPVDANGNPVLGLDSYGYPTVGDSVYGADTVSLSVYGAVGSGPAQGYVNWDDYTSTSSTMSAQQGGGAGLDSVAMQPFLDQSLETPWTFQIADDAPETVTYSVYDTTHPFFPASTGQITFSGLADLQVQVGSSPTEATVSGTPHMQVISVQPVGTDGQPISSTPDVSSFGIGTWDSSNPGATISYYDCGADSSCSSPTSLTATPDGLYTVPFAASGLTYVGVTSSEATDITYSVTEEPLLSMQYPTGTFTAGPETGGFLDVVNPHATVAESGGTTYWQPVSVTMTDASGEAVGSTDSVGISIAGAKSPATLTVASYDAATGRYTPITPDAQGLYEQTLGTQAATWYVKDTAPDTLSYGATDLTDSSLPISGAQGLFAPEEATSLTLTSPAATDVSTAGQANYQSVDIAALDANGNVVTSDHDRLNLTISGVSTSANTVTASVYVKSGGTYHAVAPQSGEYVLTLSGGEVMFYVTDTAADSLTYTVTDAYVPSLTATVTGLFLQPSTGPVSPPSGGATGSTPPAPTSNTPSVQTATEVEETVDPSTSPVTVSTQDNSMVLVLPQGSLPSGSSLTVTQESGSSVTPPPASAGLASAEWTISTSAEPTKPVQVSFHYNLPANTSPLQLGLYTLVGGQWLYYGPVTLDPATGTAAGTIAHFSTWAVMANLETFPDVPATYWAFQDISELTARGAISGYPDGTFKPGAPVTRAEFLKLVLGAVGVQPAVGSRSTFSDVSPKAWYAGVIDAAAHAGILMGDHGKALPNQPISREEAAVILMRALAAKQVQLPSEAPASYKDASSIGAWALESVSQATDLGILQGLPDGTFNAHGTLTRAQAAAMTVRVYGFLSGGSL